MGDLKGQIATGEPQGLEGRMAEEEPQDSKGRT